MNNLNDVPDQVKDFYELKDDNSLTLKARPEQKTTTDLERVIAIGKPQKVILKFAEIIANYDPWLYFDEFEVWCEECEEVREHNKNLPVIDIAENGVKEYAKPKELPQEPVRPKEKTLDDILGPYKVTLFKTERFNVLAKSTVTVSTGKRFNADETSINRMNNAITAAVDEKGSYKIKWSTDDVPTGVMIDVTKNELKEAHRLAIEQMSKIWEV